MSNNFLIDNLIGEDLIGKRIKEIRKSKGMTQKEFGQLINTSYGHISNIESGKDFPSERLIDLICWKCDINRNWLKTGHGQRNRLPLYSYSSYLDQNSREVMEKVLCVDGITSKHIHFFKIILEMSSKKNIQENSDLYYNQKLEILLASIDIYLKMASHASESNERSDFSQSVYESFAPEMEKTIIDHLKNVCEAFFYEDLNNKLDDESDENNEN